MSKTSYVPSPAKIKVVGMGGAGCNAITRMVREQIRGVEFIAMNTDAAHLEITEAPVRIALGEKLTRGLGAGGDHNVGRRSAEETRDEIKQALSGADMVFLAAGMGGGTGTGAAPVVAEIARELGILTVAVVTKPFAFEGRRQRIAQEGLDMLAQYVNSLIVVPNDKLMQVLGNQVTLDEAFRAANDVLHGAVAGIAEIMSCAGMINVDFADVKTVMSETGMAMMGSAKAAGTDRARMAAEQAVACPLLEDINIADARGVLVNISASKSLFQLQEMYDVMDVIKAFASDSATVIAGTVYEDDLEDSLRVTIVATGLGKAVPRAQPLTVVVRATGTDGAMAPGPVNYEELDQPAVIRRNRSQTVEAMHKSGVEMLDIPAFLRKQAD